MKHYANSEEYLADLLRYTDPSATLYGVTRDGGILCHDCLAIEYQLIADAIDCQPHDAQWEVVDVQVLDGKHPSQPHEERCDHCYATITKPTL